MFAVINKTRMLNGWTTKTAQELDATIRTWAEVFDCQRIPYQQYDELYKRAFKWRLDQIHREGKASDLDATLLASCWPGLRQELEQKRINERRYLSETAESVCPRCLGTNVEIVYREDGKKLGGRPGCQHKPLVEGEWFWKLANAEVGEAIPICDVPANQPLRESPSVQAIESMFKSGPRFIPPESAVDTVKRMRDTLNLSGDQIELLNAVILELRQEVGRQKTNSEKNRSQDQGV